MDALKAIEELLEQETLRLSGMVKTIETVQDFKQALHQSQRLNKALIKAINNLHVVTMRLVLVDAGIELLKKPKGRTM